MMLAGRVIRIPWASLALAGGVFAAGAAAGAAAHHHLRHKPAVAELRLELAGMREARAADALARAFTLHAWGLENARLDRALEARAASAASLTASFNEDIRNDPLPELARPVDPSRALRLCRAQAAAQGRPAADCEALAGGGIGP